MVFVNATVNVPLFVTRICRYCDSVGRSSVTVVFWLTLSDL
jgi:hypothetical protein